MTIFLTYFLPILSFMLFLNITLFYLDDFKISTYSKAIKTSQLLTPLWLIMFISGLYYYFYLNSFIADSDIILHINNNNMTNSTIINTWEGMKMNKEAAETVGRYIGYAGAAAGISGGVAKAIAKSSLPPVQKAGIIIGSSAIGGTLHMIGLNLDSMFFKKHNQSTDKASGLWNWKSSSSKFFDDYGYSQDNSELYNILLGLDILNIAYLSLVFILLINLIFKLGIMPENLKLNLSHIFGFKLNNSLNYYINKLIQLNKKTSTIYIFIILFVLLVSLSIENYFITVIRDNIDLLVDLHIKPDKG